MKFDDLNPRQKRAMVQLADALVAQWDAENAELTARVDGLLGQTQLDRQVEHKTIHRILLPRNRANVVFRNFQAPKVEPIVEVIHVTTNTTSHNHDFRAERRELDPPKPKPQTPILGGDWHDRIFGDSNPTRNDLLNAPGVELAYLVGTEGSHSSYRGLYYGHDFKSLAELHVMQRLRASGLEWEYEPDRFITPYIKPDGSNGRYHPDFYVKDGDRELVLEIKNPNLLNDETVVAKWKALVANIPAEVDAEIWPARKYFSAAPWPNTASMEEWFEILRQHRARTATSGRSDDVTQMLEDLEANGQAITTEMGEPITVLPPVTDEPVQPKPSLWSRLLGFLRLR